MSKKTTLDSIFKWPFTRISQIKIDIEGGELHALMGGERLIKRSCSVIIFEHGMAATARTYSYNKEDFFGYFQRLGYSIFYISGKKFDVHCWENPEQCWEFVALPVEKEHLVDACPLYCRQATDTLAVIPTTLFVFGVWYIFREQGCLTNEKH